MSDDYISRLRSELLRAGATKPARWRRPLVPGLVAPVGVAAAVTLLAALIVLTISLTRGEEQPVATGESARLEFHVEPPGKAAATETAQVLRARLSAAGVRGAQVTVGAGGAVLTVTAPTAAREDVIALTQRGRVGIYDWERSVLGPDGRPAVDDPRVTGGPDAGRSGALSKREATERASGLTTGGPVRAPADAPDGWYVLGGSPALTDAEIATAEAVTSRAGQRPGVAIQFTSSGRSAFGTLTRELAQRGSARSKDGGDEREVWQHLAILVDDQLVTIAFINPRENPDGIDGSTGTLIEGGFTPEQARQLAAIIDSGPLPANLSMPTGAAPRSRWP